MGTTNTAVFDQRFRKQPRATQPVETESNEWMRHLTRDEKTAYEQAGKIRGHKDVLREYMLPLGVGGLVTLLGGGLAGPFATWAMIEIQESRRVNAGNKIKTDLQIKALMRAAKLNGVGPR